MLLFCFSFVSLSPSLSRLRAVCPYACCWLVSPFARTVVALSSSWALVRIYKQKNIWITHVKTERESDKEGGRARAQIRDVNDAGVLSCCCCCCCLMLMPNICVLQRFACLRFARPFVALAEREQKKITANSRAGI